MATKTITITVDAYKRLRSKKASNESFTDIILKLTRKKDTLAYIRSMKPSTELADNIEKAMQLEQAKKVRHLLETLDILELSIAASETFGKLSIDFRKKGNDIGDFDLLIASIALTHGEPLLTKNANHFSRVPGLAVETY